MLVQWDESYSLGIPIIDKQHRELFKMLNDLDQSMHQGRGKRVAAVVLQRLYAFISGHFEEEEKMLQRANATMYFQCRVQHTEKLERLRSFLANKSAHDPSAVIDLLYFVDSWLGEHIHSDLQSLSVLRSYSVQ